MNDAVDAIGIALQVTSALDALGVVHTIGGSIASSMAGEPRSTIDVDVVADLKAEHVAGLVAALQQDFYLDETALRRAVADLSSANLIHHETSIKIDLFIAGGTPLDSHQIARRIKVEIGGTSLVRPSAGRHSAAEVALVSERGRGLRPAVARRAGHRPGPGRPPGSGLSSRPSS